MNGCQWNVTIDQTVESRRRRICTTAVGVLAFVVLLPASAAHADAPRNRACFGKDISTYARGGGAEFGQFMAGMAQSSEGVSDEVAYHKAGLVPDAVASNSCND